MLNVGKIPIFTFLSEKGHFEEPGGDFFSCDVWQLAASMHCRATASPGGELCGGKSRNDVGTHVLGIHPKEPIESELMRH